MIFFDEWSLQKLNSVFHIAKYYRRSANNFISPVKW